MTEHKKQTDLLASLDVMAAEVAGNAERRVLWPEMLLTISQSLSCEISGRSKTEFFNRIGRFLPLVTEEGAKNLAKVRKVRLQRSCGNFA